MPAEIVAREAPPNQGKIACDRVVRDLPGRRQVCAGRWGDEAVYVKRYIHPRRAARHWRRELTGLQSLHRSGIATASLLYAGPAGDGRELLIVTRSLPDTITLAEAWAACADVSAQTDLLHRVLHCMGRLHAQGLVHLDAHMNNFLVDANEVYVLDGAEIKSYPAGLPAAVARDNLAQLLANLPDDMDERVCGLQEIYARAAGVASDAGERQRLRDRITARRRLRLAKYLQKIFRECTAFAVSKDFGRYCVQVRARKTPALQALLDDPDAALRTGDLLKRGNTATVGVAQIAGQGVVIKRYNIKNFLHGLNRAWRPSRAAHAWRNAHLLGFYGIDTPAPIALIEERLGPLRRRAFLISDYVEGPDGSSYLRDAEVPWPDRQRVAQAMLAMIRRLGELRIAHGDLKATNFLIHDGRPWLIDLDSLRQYRSASWYNSARKRDIRRFLRNWRDEPALLQQFETLTGES